MNFKESVKNYLGNSLNEMALKHLEGTEDLWKKQDKEVEIADKYIKNALADGKTYTQILRGLGSTFGSKKLRDMEGRVVKPFIVKEIVLETVREKMKKEESTRYRSNSLNEEKSLSKRIDDAASDVEQRIWEIVAKHFPEVKKIPRNKWLQPTVDLHSEIEQFVEENTDLFD